jgi:hypothetical protein
VNILPLVAEINALTQLVFVCKFDLLLLLILAVNVIVTTLRRYKILLAKSSPNKASRTRRRREIRVRIWFLVNDCKNGVVAGRLFIPEASSNNNNCQ